MLSWFLKLPSTWSWKHKYIESLLSILYSHLFVWNFTLYLWHEGGSKASKHLRSWQSWDFHPKYEITLPGVVLSVAMFIAQWESKKIIIFRFLLDSAWLVNCELNISLASSGYLQWESWSACPDVCGVRYHQVRRRVCLNPTRKIGGADCSGLRSETRETGCYTPCLGRLWELLCGISSHNRYMTTNAWQMRADLTNGLWIQRVGYCKHRAP